MELRSFKGAISAVLTPSHDVEAKISELVDFHLKNNVRGFFVLGTAGEGVKISPALRKKIAEAFVNSVGSKGIVVVHVGAADVETVIDLTRHASKIGADAVASIFPFYYKYDLESIINFYTKVIQSSAIPVIAYNNPAVQGYQLKTLFVEQLLERVNDLAGIKDSSNDPELLLSLSQKFNEKPLIASGRDELIMYSLSIGLRSQVSAIASIYPELVSALIEVFNSDKKAEALKLQHRINVLKEVLESFGPYHAVCKHALKLRGIDIGAPYPPTRDLTPSEALELQNVLARITT